MRRLHAFTLLEAMVALSIAGIIIAGAMGSVVNINRLVSDTSRRAALWDESKRLEEYVIARVQGAGGGQIRPHASVLVDDGADGCGTITGMPACNNADRLTIITQDNILPACSVSGTSGANLNVNDDAPGHCCLDAPLPTAFENKQALVIGTNGIVSVFLFNRHGPCAINAPPGQGAGLLPTALAAAGYPATLVVVTSNTIYVDTAAHKLLQWDDLDGDGTVDAGESATIHDEVYDMQIALGYDGIPENGDVVDNNNTTDEWLFNVTGDPTGVGAGALASVNFTQLRMIEVGMVMGVRSQVRGGNSLRLLNGPSRTVSGTYLASTMSKAFLRNLNLFTQ